MDRSRWDFHHAFRRIGTIDVDFANSSFDTAEEAGATACAYERR